MKNYSVNCYGEGTLDEIILSLRQLANSLDNEVERDNMVLNYGDGYESDVLVIDLEEA